MNFDSVWQRELSESIFGFAATVFLAPFNPYLSSLRFLNFYQKDLTVWDNMNLSVDNKHFGILAHDTHSKLKYSKEHFLRWPDYLETFKLGSNLVFLKEPPSDDFFTRKSQIYQSIKEGRLALVFDVVHPYDGIEHYFACDGRNYESGDVVPSGASCKLSLSFPENFKADRVIKILKDGELFKEWSTSDSIISEKIEGSGTYRTEIWVKRHSLFHIMLHRDVPYVFYNPIYLR